MIFFILASIVALEFGIHIIYHWKTGKAGLYDPPFDYLIDIWRRINGSNSNH